MGVPSRTELQGPKAMVSTIHPAIVVCLKIFLVLLCNMWDLSSPTRDGTRIPYSASVESKPLDCQGSSISLSFFSLTSSLLLPGIINQCPTCTQGGSGGGGGRLRLSKHHRVSCSPGKLPVRHAQGSTTGLEKQRAECGEGERREQIRCLMRHNLHM